MLRSKTILGVSDFGLPWPAPVNHEPLVSLEFFLHSRFSAWFDLLSQYVLNVQPMNALNGQLQGEGIPAIVIISQDKAFISRLHALALKSRGTKLVVSIFHEMLGALGHLLIHPALVVVFDIDSDSPERNLEALRAIRRICRHVPIILGAFEHSTSRFGVENDVGIFYRIVKSAPDWELETAIESARRNSRR